MEFKSKKFDCETAGFIEDKIAYLTITENHKVYKWENYLDTNLCCVHKKNQCIQC